MKTFRTFTFALAAMALAGLLFTGCLNDSSNTGDASLTLKMKVSDMDNISGNNSLGKGSVIKLKKLVITLTSSLSTDAVIRDTVIASDSVGSKFSTTTSSDQSFTKAYAIKPLRNWTMVVKTLDTRDSVVHKDSVVALKLLAGETRSVVLNLAARYVSYQVKFSVPDSLRSAATNQAQKIIITRFVMKIDSVTAIDSTVLSGFAPSPAIDSATFDYILANSTPNVTLKFYGHSAGTNDTLLFQADIPNVDPEELHPAINAVYVGPGANGGGAINKLIINIGKINTIVFSTNVDGTVPFKSSASK